MSTADGAILAMGTVFAHNIVRQLDAWKPDLISAKNLLWVTRLATIPLSMASAMIAAYYTSDNPQGATGYLLIVAFDVMLATAVVPLFGCFYVKNPSPTAALVAVLVGAIVRTVLEFTLPKDGYLLLPYDVPEFQDVGPAASAKFPVFFDVPAEDLWDPSVEVCDTRQFEDYTGVDSLSALLASFLAFVTVQLIEDKMGRRLFTFPGMHPYAKNLGGDEEEELEKSKKTEAEEPPKEVEMAQEQQEEEEPKD
jgi:Na+/proline symporter